MTLSKSNTNRKTLVEYPFAGTHFLFLIFFVVRIILLNYNLFMNTDQLFPSNGTTSIVGCLLFIVIAFK